jgi:hypothetical protein
MGVFVVPYTVKDVLAKGVSSLCISLLIVNLITDKVSRILNFCKILGDSSIHSKRIKMPKRGVNWAFLKINYKN